MAPRRTLRELIVRHGPGLCSDARRCEGLLRDLCGEHRREINILLGALRERVPLDLLAGRNSVPSGLLLTRLAKRLEDHLALTAAASRWAVDSWALALGVVSDAELRGLESRREEAARPGAERETQAGRTAASAGPQPPATQTPARQSPRPPAAQPPLATQPPPAAPTQARRPPPAQTAPRTHAPGGPATVARRQPAPPAPAPPQAANTGRLQTPAADDAAVGGRGRRRGCLVGCFLLLLLCVLLFVGGPWVLSVLREEQQQRNSEPSPVQTR